MTGEQEPNGQFIVILLTFVIVLACFLVFAHFFLCYLEDRTEDYKVQKNVVVTATR